MKTVYDNAMVAHIWANQSQGSARSSNGNFWFSGNTINSYQTPIARIVTAVNGKTVILRTCNTYSVTTSGKHERAIDRAIGYDGNKGPTQFKVPFVTNPHIDEGKTHAANLEYLLKAARAELVKVNTARFDSYDASTYDESGRPVDPTHSTAMPRFLNGARHRFQVAARYAELFAVPSEFDGGREVLTALDVWRLRFAAYDSPTARHKRELARSARLRAAERVAEREIAERQAQLSRMFAAWQAGESTIRPRANDFQAGSTERAALEAAEQTEYQERFALEAARRDKWLAGESVSFHGYDIDGRSALIRAVNVTRNALGEITGGTLQTSQGATVPLVEAVKVFRFLKLIRERGESWHRNGQTVRVGLFQLDSIDPDGSFKAGCHLFRFDEVARLARELGLFDVPPDDSAALKSMAVANPESSIWDNRRVQS